MTYRDAKISDYLADAASDKPAPGGGSVSALAAALATTMGSMAANFTLGREKFAAVQPQIARILDALEGRRRELLDLVDQDVAAYTDLSAAYALPKDTAELKSVRRERIQEALTLAMRVPLRIMESSLAALENVAELTDIANPNLLSDVGVSAMLLEASLRAAWLNVEVNLASIKDPKLVTETREHVRQLLDRAQSLLGRVLDSLHAHPEGQGAR
jgi:methenyltetrahydrofolate cyclohydrolase